MANHRISLQPNTIARVLGTIAIILIIGNIIVHLVMAYITDYHEFYGFVQFFNLDDEYNLPTAFSVLLLLFSALLLAIIGLLNRKESNEQTFYWILLSFIFVFLAIDEAWQIHEMLGGPARSLLGDDRWNIFHWAWVVPAFAIVVILGLLFLKFLIRLPSTTRNNFILAGALYVGGAIGIETIAGWHVGLHGMKNLTYSMIATLEEVFEITGVILFIWALLKYIKDNFKEMRITF